MNNFIAGLIGIITGAIIPIAIYYLMFKIDLGIPAQLISRLNSKVYKKVINETEYFDSHTHSYMGRSEIKPNEVQV